MLATRTLLSPEYAVPMKPWDLDESAKHSKILLVELLMSFVSKRRHQTCSN